MIIALVSAVIIGLTQGEYRSSKNSGRNDWSLLKSSHIKRALVPDAWDDWEIKRSEHKKRAVVPDAWDDWEIKRAI
uniref:EYE53-2 n=1 Tax=Schmidtea mediterranea TaxID=79327 RepID=E3CTJ9_SCHMD|nr:TPA_inf: EYE53-2 [Schmidtea mediterranea]